MKKLILLLLFIPLVSFGQVGQLQSDDWPETLYVSGIEISNIPTDLITVQGICILKCEATINWGQKYMNDSKGKSMPNWTHIVTEQVPTKKNTLKFTNKMALFNYLENNGWAFIGLAGDGEYLFRRKK